MQREVFDPSVGIEEERNSISDILTIIDTHLRLLDLGGYEVRLGKKLAGSRLFDHQKLKLKKWLLNKDALPSYFIGRKINLLDILTRPHTSTIRVPKHQATIDKAAGEMQFKPDFNEALCNFYGIAKKEILIFTPNFSEKIYNNAVVAKLAELVDRGVTVRIIVKNSEFSKAGTEPEALKTLKLKLDSRNLVEPSEGVLVSQLNSGVPPRLTKFLDSCTSAFSVVDRKHFRYRQISSNVYDAGIFVFNAEHYVASNALISSLIFEVFAKSSKMISTYQNESFA